MSDESIGVAAPPACGQASLSTVARGCRLSSAEAWKMLSASIGSMVATVRKFLLISSTLSSLAPFRGRSIKDLREAHRVSVEAMANIVPESWRDRVFRAGGQGASGQSISEVLPPAHDETTSSSRTRYKSGKLVNRESFVKRHIASLKQLPETTPPRGTGDLHGGETGGFARARRRSQSYLRLL